MKQCTAFMVIMLLGMTAFAAGPTGIDYGTLLNRSSGDSYSRLIPGEWVFENPQSGATLFYRGQERGSGVFFLRENGAETIILKTSLRYGPMIIWHGEQIAEIYIPTGSPFRHSYIYDFSDGFLSQPFNFVIYVDPDYNTLIGVDDGCLVLYDARSGSEVKEFVFDKIIEEHFDEDTGEVRFFYRTLNVFQLFISGYYDIEKPRKDTLTIRYFIEDSAHNLGGEFSYAYPE